MKFNLWTIVAILAILSYGTQLYYGWGVDDIVRGSIIPDNQEENLIVALDSVVESGGCGCGGH